MMLHILIGAIPIPSHSHQTNCNLLFTFTPNKPHHCSTLCRASRQNPPPLTNASSAPALLRFVGNAYTREEDKDETDRDRGGDEEEGLVSSASAVAALIRNVSTSPVDFVQRIEQASDGRGGRGLVLPSVDFRRLCLEQLDLFRRIVHPDAFLSYVSNVVECVIRRFSKVGNNCPNLMPDVSIIALACPEEKLVLVQSMQVYVRPAGSYVMDRLELRCITLYPVEDAADIVILVANFRVPAGLRIAEAVLSSRHAELFPELRSVVFPLVKHPFIVGFLVAEFPNMNLEGEEPRPSPAQSCFLPSITDSKLLEIQTNNGKSTEMFNLTIEQRLNAVNISRSLAMAYVMDQKAILLQQSSWQNNVRMSSLVEQIRGSLSSIRTLSKMLSVQIKRSEIAFDIVEDILVQGNHMQDIIQQLQDAVYLTKANIIHNNREKLKKMYEPTDGLTASRYPNLEPYEAFPVTSTSKDSEVPMPPLALAPLQQKAIRKPCDVADVLNDLIGAVEPLARMQQRLISASEFCGPLQVAVEEPALRQALSNLIEGALLRTQVGGKVEIVCTGAPAGGVLIIIDDDGPDMHYMTQMHSLTPFGMDLFSEDKVEDNMTWNFVAGLTVGREILESYGCVVRVISPRISEVVGIQGRGTRIEIWLPYYDCPDPATGEFDEVL